MRDSFVLYSNYYDILNESSNEDIGTIFRAILTYVKNGTVIDLPSHLRLAFGFIKNQLDLDDAKYNEKIKKMKQNGKKGGLAKAKKEESVVANLAIAKFAKHNDNVNDNDNDNDNVNVNVNENDNDNVNDNDIYNNKLIKFKKPTIKEIEDYCLERNNSIDSRYFYDYYESKGWLIGKTKMKDFKAAIRLWEQNQKKFEQQKQKEIEEEDFDYDNTPYRPF